MAQPQERREQISVPVDPDLRAAIERAADAEHRTMAGQIRYWIVAALANQSGAAAARQVAR
jgi:hypothetical protein